MHIATTTISFVDKWQTLIGSALGAFLTMLLSLVGFWIGSIYKSWKDRKESIRMVEVSITRTINDNYSTRKKLDDFIERLKVLSADARAVTSDETFFLDRINFPAVRDIFFNTDLPDLKFGSTYLHNQLMFADSGIKEVNSWLKKMEKNFDTMLTKNDFLVGLSPKPTPRDQRKGYAENLDLFAKAVSDFSSSIKKGTKMIMQIKIYNLKLMHSRLKTVIIFEGVSFRYFKNRAIINEYKKWSGIIDRINKKIEHEVEISLASAEKGFREIKLQ